MDKITSNTHLESSLEGYLHAQVRKRGGRTYKLNPAGNAGIPDRLVLLPPGRVLLVELKAKNGKLRPAQKVWHAKAAAMGVPVFIPRTREDIDQWLHMLSL